MELTFVVPKRKVVVLGKLAPGIDSAFCFADSADTTEDFFKALQDVNKNFFMVIDGSGAKEGEVDIISLDGKQILRRSADRRVRKFPEIDTRSLSSTFTKDQMLTRASNIEVGKIAVYQGRDCIKVQGNPAPPGKVILVSLLDGKKVLADDDLLLQAGDMKFCLTLHVK